MAGLGATRAPAVVVVLVIGLVGSAGCRSAPSSPSLHGSRIVELPRGGGIRCQALSWPLAAAVSSGFGWRDGRMHDGIDLVVPQGTAVTAACDGRVAYAGEKLRGYGRLIIVDHGDGLTTVYAHNRELLVSEGMPVARGQLIARSGATGRVTAPHLHFEVRRGGRPLDPLPFLPR